MPAPEGAPGALARLGYGAFRRLPAALRRTAVRMGTPSYTVGAVCVIAHGERVLLLCQRHRPDWSLPGGLLDRGEDPATAVRREVREEIGLDVLVDLPVTTLVDPRLRRVDVVYRVEVPTELVVHGRGEVRRAAWMRPADLRPEDWIAAGVLAAVDRALRPGTVSGRLLGGAPSP